MRKLAFLAVLALAAVPAAFAGNSPTPTTSASALCRQQRTAMGTSAFTSLYAGNSNAFGRGVSKVGGTLDGDQANAAKQCAAERADATFPASHDGKSFDEFYGTGPHGRNAFGKCVSSKSQTLADQQQQSTIKAAKTG